MQLATAIELSNHVTDLSAEIATRRSKEAPFAAAHFSSCRRRSPRMPPRPSETEETRGSRELKVCVEFLRVIYDDASTSRAFDLD